MSSWSNMCKYSEDNVNIYAPTKGGVYILIKKHNNRYIPFFVGKSNNIQIGLLDHLSVGYSYKSVNEELIKHICYFIYSIRSSAGERERVEKDVIIKFKPSCNE